MNLNFDVLISKLIVLFEKSFSSCWLVILWLLRKLLILNVIFCDNYIVQKLLTFILCSCLYQGLFHCYIINNFFKNNSFLVFCRHGLQTFSCQWYPPATTMSLRERQSLNRLKAIITSPSLHWTSPHSIHQSCKLITSAIPRCWWRFLFCYIY